MEANKALRELANITASQWGMFTTAQAGMLGVPRLTLSRLTSAGHLERLAHGVYRDAGAPGDQFEDLRAAWLSTEPKFRAEERLRNPVDGLVVASSSAALLHGVGDLWADRHEFVTSKHRQTQRPEIRYRQRNLEKHDVTLVEGLPVMTLERTLSDLLEDVGDLSLVADALGAAAKKRPLDFERLRELLEPLAERNGFRRHDGNSVLERLLEISGLDLDSVAHRLSKDPVLSSRIFDHYLQTVMPPIDIPNMGQLTELIKQQVPDLSIDTTRKILEAIRPQFEINNKTWLALFDSKALKNVNTFSEFIDTTEIANIAQLWTKNSTSFRIDPTEHSSESTRTRLRNDG